MPRRARLLIPGLPLHIVQRGNNRAPCFHNDRDRMLYLALLTELSEHFDCAVHAYVLMDNHVHLLLTPGECSALSQLMRNLGQRYVQWFNRRHGRSGTLWEGRFRSSIVDSERYLLTCLRYIELNPVRAGMVGTPGDYPWSSFHANARGIPSRLVTPHEIYRQLGRDDDDRRAAYSSLFLIPLAREEIERIRAALRKGKPLGDSGFVSRLMTGGAAPEPPGPAPSPVPRADITAPSPG